MWQTIPQFWVKKRIVLPEHFNGDLGNPKTSKMNMAKKRCSFYCHFWDDFSGNHCNILSKIITIISTMPTVYINGMNKTLQVIIPGLFQYMYLFKTCKNHRTNVVTFVRYRLLRGSWEWNCVLSWQEASLLEKKWICCNKTDTSNRDRMTDHY